MKFRQAGSILIVVVGMLALLMLLTLSVGRRAQQELNLVQYSLNKLQARYIAWAGFHYALYKMREDALDEVSSRTDDILACGVKLEAGQTMEDLFQRIPVGKGEFDILPSRESLRFGFGDEDGKINLNALDFQTIGVFRELLIIVGLTDTQAQRAAVMVLDWQDEDDEMALKSSSEQESGYQWDKQSLLPKNRPFNGTRELMFIPEVTEDIYDKIRGSLTVYPRRPAGFRINFSTASRSVLLAVARHFAGPQTNTSKSDADSLIRKIVSLRAGADRVEGTGDDRLIVEKDLNLNLSEETLWRTMSQFDTKTSRFLSFQVRGREKVSRRQSRIDAVVDRESLTVVFWRQD